MKATRRPSGGLRQRYAGTYVYVGGEAGRQAVNTAVDTAVDDMGLAKAFARKALLEHAVIRQTYTISFVSQDDVQVSTPGDPPELSPSDGTEVKSKNKSGDEVRLMQHFVDGVLVQQGHTDSGGGRTEFKLQPDNKTLLVRRVMESPQLPKPVDFTLTYRRQ